MTPIIASTLRAPRASHAVWLNLLGSVLSLAVTGCGSSTAKPQISAINFTDANGNTVPVSAALKAGAGIYLDVTLKNDSGLLGANWSVTCSSQLPPGTPLPPGQTIDESCGFFSPVHTGSGPVPQYATSGAGIVTLYQAPRVPPKAGTVTLYASATTDPAITSTITLPVMP